MVSATDFFVVNCDAALVATIGMIESLAEIQNMETDWLYIESTSIKDLTPPKITHKEISTLVKKAANCLIFN